MAHGAGGLPPTSHLSGTRCWEITLTQVAHGVQSVTENGTIYINNLSSSSAILSDSLAPGHYDRLTST